MYRFGNDFTKLVNDLEVEEIERIFNIKVIDGNVYRSVINGSYYVNYIDAIGNKCYLNFNNQDYKIKNRKMECVKCGTVILGSDGLLCQKCVRDLQDNVREIDITKIREE